MSKAKDRARAESGSIFRDGHLVNREEWYAAHPTKQMRQVGVDKAVADQMASMFPKDAVVVPCGAPPSDYFCTKCNRKHKLGSKIHEQHQDFIEVG